MTSLFDIQPQLSNTDSPEPSLGDIVRAYYLLHGISYKDAMKYVEEYEKVLATSFVGGVDTDAATLKRKAVVVPYVERFSESSGEGGGVYPDEDGGFVRYSDYAELYESKYESATATPAQPVVSCQCRACKDGAIHASDCAVHNAPALPVGECDCDTTAPAKSGEPVRKTYAAIMAEELGYQPTTAVVLDDEKDHGRGCQCPACNWDRSHPEEMLNDEREEHLELLDEVLGAKNVMLAAGCKQATFGEMFAEYALLSASKAASQCVACEAGVCSAHRPAAPAQSGEPEQRPFAWFQQVDDYVEFVSWLKTDQVEPPTFPLYAAPQVNPAAVVLDDERAAFEEARLALEDAYSFTSTPRPALEKISIALDKLDQIEKARAALPQPVAQTEFPYQQTFDAIAAAIECSVPDVSIAISIRKFQDKFNDISSKKG